MARLPADASDRRLEVVALLIAAALALPAERRWLGYSPGRAGAAPGPRRTAMMAAAGLGGLAVIVWSEGLLAPHVPWTTATSAAVAVVWVVLAAPALFERLAWAQ
jgi:hypothetical protein